MLLRGIVAAAFGLGTVFWQQPSDRGGAIATALYLLLSAATVLWLRKALTPAAATVHKSLVPETVFLALAGLVALVLSGPMPFAIAVGLGLLLAGASAVLAGWRARRDFQLAKDVLSMGVVTLATGIVLPLFIPLGTKALLGVVGGSAIILAVLLLLAALSYRHDARQSDQRP